MNSFFFFFFFFLRKSSLTILQVYLNLVNTRKNVLYESTVLRTKTNEKQTWIKIFLFVFKNTEIGHVQFRVSLLCTTRFDSVMNTTVDFYTFVGKVCV